MPMHSAATCPEYFAAERGRNGITSIETRGRKKIAQTAVSETKRYTFLMISTATCVFESGTQRSRGWL